MKKISSLFLLLVSIAGFSQEEGRFGITAGLNEYYMDADFLFSKSGVGFSLGVVATVPVSEHSEVVSELSIARYNVQLMGRENQLAQPEWIKFNMDRINLTAVYDYDLIHFLNGDLALGLNAGPSIAFFTTFNAIDESKEKYLLDPYYIEADRMRIDQYMGDSGNISINVFAALGLSVRYKNIEANLRYYKGITDTYRKFSMVSNYAEFTGKDNYAGLNFTYYFGNNF